MGSEMMSTDFSDTSAIHVKLWGSVFDELSRANLGIDPACYSELQTFINTGVTELQSRKKEPAASEKAEGACLKLRLFARQLAAASLAAGSKQVTKSKFDAIKSLLCPLYPFCD